MGNDIKNYIRNNLLFEDVDIDELDFSSIKGALIFKKSGEFIIKTDSLAENFYLIIDGEVTTSRKGEKKVLSENGFFGKEAAKGEPVYGYIAVADKDTLLLGLTSDEAISLIEQNPKLSENLEKDFDGIIHSDDELENIAEEKTADKIEKEILSDFPEQEEKQKIIEMKFDSIKAAEIIASVFESPAHFSSELLNDISTEIEDGNIIEKLNAIRERNELIETAAKKARVYSALPSEYQTEVWELTSLLNEFAENLTEKFGCEVKIESVENIKIEADKISFQAALEHVIANSCEAMEETNPVIIQVNKNTDLAEILISDSGTGVPLEFSSEIFEPFFSYGKENHIGLGLAIADKIIKGNNGKIAVKSTDPNGTVISIILPIVE